MSGFRLMTYNVEYSNRDPAASIEAIAAGDADVVLLQEITRRWQDALEARFAAGYADRRYHLHARAAGGLAILSRLPIRAIASHPSPTAGWFPADLAVVATPFGDVQLLNVHLRPPIDGGSWVRGYLTTPPMRLAEIRSFWPHVSTALPVIVAGDFNETPSGRAVGFLDAHGLARAIPTGPTTWHFVTRFGGTPRDVLRFDLDHVMTRGLAVTNARVLDAGTSDHRPVVVDIAAA